MSENNTYQKCPFLWREDLVWKQWFLRIYVGCIPPQAVESCWNLPLWTSQDWSEKWQNTISVYRMRKFATLSSTGIGGHLLNYPDLIFKEQYKRPHLYSPELPFLHSSNHKINVQIYHKSIMKIFYINFQQYQVFLFQ